MLRMRKTPLIHFLPVGIFNMFLFNFQYLFAYFSVHNYYSSTKPFDTYLK